MEAYKVKVRITATILVTKQEWYEEGGCGPFTPSQAKRFAKGEICERLRNNPNYGSCTAEKCEVKDEEHAG